MPILNWIGKEAVINHDKEVLFRLLKKIKSISVGKNSQNLIIHGDNLEALKSLMPFYYEKIKCIYIDPPYNTGNEKWVYNDKVNSPKIKKWLGKVVGGESEDLCRHDKWLCMMYPRLRLLRELLSDDGAIFISINYLELYHLRSLCDEIFGESNFLQLVSVESASTASFRSINLCPVNVAEYILMYAKDKDKFSENIIYIESKYSEDYSHYIENYNDDPKKWKLKKIDNYIYKREGVNNWREFKEKYGKIWKEIRYQLKSEFAEKNKNKVVSLNTLQKPSKTIQELITKSKQKRGVVFVHQREKTNDIYIYNGRTLAFYGSKFREVDGVYKVSEILTNIWNDISFLSLGHEGEVDFKNGKKPIKLIKRIINLCCSKNDLILDSFAGSGTTGHAVMDLNKEDGGNRKFILVEMEKDIAKKITAKRIKRSIKKYKYKERFEYCELDKPLFNNEGQIDESCNFNQLATYIYFTETQTNIDKNKIKNNFIGSFNETDYFLIFKGKDKNVLNKTFIRKLKKSDNKKVIYADKCLIDNDILNEMNIEFKQIPYQIKIY